MLTIRALLALFLSVLLLVAPAAYASDGELMESPDPAEPPPANCVHTVSEVPLLTKSPVTLDCSSALLLEPESGQIIFEKNASERRPVASVTKLMSILLTLEAIDSGRAALTDTVVVSPQAEQMGGSQVLLDVSETQPLSVLLKSMIVASANDATVAVAEHLYGSEELFVARMNERAEKLGLSGTHYKNATGLPVEGQYTTARDIASIMLHVIDHEVYFRYSGIWLDELDHGDGRITQLTNTNRLVRLYEGCDGGKTGSTNEAGYCISATAKRGSMRLIAIVLGGTSSKARFADAQSMLDYGFANYRLYPVAESGTKVRGGIPVNGGDKKVVSLELLGNLTLLTQKGTSPDVQLIPSLPESIQAPVAKGDKIGTVDIMKDGVTLKKLDVVASEDVEARGYLMAFSRIFDLFFLFV